MAKKTVKKQPLKVAGKGAVKATPKAPAKTAGKTAVKAAPKNAVKAKETKVVPKKEQKPLKAVPATVAKKTGDKKSKEAPSVIVEKVSSKEPVLKTKAKSLPKETMVVDTEAKEPLVVEPAVATKPEKVKNPKKKTAAQKKKEKLEIDSNAKWADLFEKYKQVKPVNYSMRDAFEANQPIQHKVLGWGWVMSSENDRLEVLFKDGKKVLISNYKS